MKYTCSYTSGGGIEYDGGIWEKKETTKLITFLCIKEPFYNINWNKLVLHKDPKKSHHPYTNWGDGTYTIYPDQCGTPYYFEPK